MKAYHPRIPLGKQVAADIAAIKRKHSKATFARAGGAAAAVGVFAERYFGIRGTMNGRPL